MNYFMQYLWPKVKLSKHPSTNSTWLELFFDLMYVIIFSSLLNYTLNSKTLWSVFEIFTIIVFSIQIWISVSMYLAVVNIHNLKIRVSIFIQIFLLILLNYGINTYATNPTLFFIIWIINMLFRLIWLLPLKTKQASFQQLIPYTLVMISIVCVFVISLNLLHFNMKVTRIVYFSLAIIIWLMSFIKKIDAKSDVTIKLLEYMRERWGLIVLIVLAELLISSINHFNKEVFNVNSIVELLLNFFYIINLWTMYYDQISHIGIKRNNIQLWSAMHTLLIFNLTILGIATRIWVDKEIHTLNLSWFWIGANVSLLLLIAFIRNISEFECDSKAKEYWNKQKPKQIKLTLILALVFLITAPLLAHYASWEFNFGLDISLVLLTSNLHTASKLAAFLHLNKISKKTQKNWEKLES